MESKWLIGSVTAHGLVLVGLAIFTGLRGCPREEPPVQAMQVVTLVEATPAPPEPAPPEPTPPEPEPPPPEPPPPEPPPPDPIPEPVPEPDPIPEPEPERPRIRRPEDIIKSDTRIVRKPPPEPQPERRVIQRTPPAPTPDFRDRLRNAVTSETPRLPQGPSAADEILNIAGLLREKLYAAWSQPVGMARGLTAEVSLRVNRDGSVSNVSLARGSGEPAMDRTVLEAARTVTFVRPLPPGHPRPFESFRIPFVLQ